jgi:flagellar assembly factor FliW
MDTSENMGNEQDRGAEAVLHIPEGMLGFSRLTRYVLADEEGLRPFLRLQCLDDPNLAFPVVDAQLIDKDYFQLLPHKELASLKIRNRSELLVLVVTILRPAPGESSVNLKAPLLINPALMIGRQIILTESPEARTPVAGRLAHAASATANPAISAG